MNPLYNSFFCIVIIFIMTKITDHYHVTDIYVRKPNVKSAYKNGIGDYLSFIFILPLFLLLWGGIAFSIAWFITWILYSISHLLYNVVAFVSSIAFIAFIVSFFIPYSLFPSDVLKRKTKEVSVPNIKNESQPFDLSSMNFSKLTEELNGLLNKPNPETIFGKWWQSKHYPHDQERLDHITSFIKKLREANSELGHLQHELYIAPKVLEAAVNGSLAQFKHEADLQLASYKNEISKMEDEMKSRQILLEAAELQNLKTRAEINLMTATTQEAKAKADLIMYVVKELDLKNMPQTLQTYLISSIVNPNGSQFNDFDMQEQLKQYVIKEAEGKARSTLAKAQQEEAQTRINDATANNTVFNLDSIRNKPKS